MDIVVYVKNVLMIKNRNRKPKDNEKKVLI